MGLIAGAVGSLTCTLSLWPPLRALGVARALSPARTCVVLKAAGFGLVREREDRLKSEQLRLSTRYRSPPPAREKLLCESRLS